MSSSFWQVDFRGDVITNEGQLGTTVYSTLAGNVVLTPPTNFSELYFRYYLNNSTGGTVSVTLPLINTALFVINRVDLGWTTNIKNTGTDTIDIITPTTALTLISIDAGETATIIARQNDGDALTDWIVQRKVSTALSAASAPTNASYITLSNDATLTAERVLTAGTNISIVDGGAGSTATISSTAVGGGSTSTYTETNSSNSPWGNITLDQAVSALDDGTLVAGFGDFGSASKPPNFNPGIGMQGNDYVSASIKTNYGLGGTSNQLINVYRRFDGTYAIRIVTLGGTSGFDRPTYGTEFVTSMIGELVKFPIAVLSPSSFVVATKIINDTSFVAFTYDAGTSTILSEGAAVITPDSVIAITSLTASSFVYCNAVGDTLNARHFTVAGTVITPTAALQTGITATNEDKFVISPKLNSTDFILASDTEVKVIRWDGGTMTFSAGAATASTLNVSSGLSYQVPVVLSPTLFVTYGVDAMYNTFTVAGLVITAETSGAIGTSTSIGLAASMDNRGSGDVVASFLENDTRNTIVVHGTVSGVTPAITWGTESILRTRAASFATLNVNSVVEVRNAFREYNYAMHYCNSTRIASGNAILYSATINQSASTITVDEYEGESPIGIAQETRTAGAPSAMDVTIYGIHTFASSFLIPGELYYAHGDGSITNNIYPKSSVNQVYDPRILGVALSANELFVNPV
jgi:hypothetical protein